MNLKHSVNTYIHRRNSMTEKEINHLAYQFNKKTYIQMIVNQYKTDPKEARTQCKFWMDSFPLVLADLGVLVKAELEKGNDE